MSHFGEFVKKLRKEQRLTCEAVARRIGSHKGYISGIENDKVSPPSVKLIRRYAKCLRQDVHLMVRLAWVDKAPPMIQKDAEEFLRWFEKKDMAGGTPAVQESPAPFERR